MNRIAITLGALLLLLIGGCGPQYSIAVSYDEFTGSRTVSMYANRIETPGNKGVVIFDLSRITPKDGPPNFYASVIFGNSDWLFIESELPVVFLIDGVTYEVPLTQSGVSRTVGVPLIFETFSFPIDRELIETIAMAKVVKMRLRGKYNFDVGFQPVNLQRIQQFYRKFVAEQSSGATS